MKSSECVRLARKNVSTVKGGKGQERVKKGEEAALVSFNLSEFIPTSP